MPTVGYCLSQRDREGKQRILLIFQETRSGEIVLKTYLRYSAAGKWTILKGLEGFAGYEFEVEPMREFANHSKK